MQEFSTDYKTLLAVKGWAKDQWCIKDESDKSSPFQHQENGNQRHTYRKWPLYNSQEIDLPPAFWGYSFLEPGNHTEKHLYYLSLTPQQNLKLECKSNHFFQKPHLHKKRSYWFGCTHLAKLMQIANVNTRNLISHAFDLLILNQWFTNAN